MKMLSTGMESTIENYITLSTIVFGKDSRPTKYLETMVEDSLEGIKEEIETDEGQMVQLLGGMFVEEINQTQDPHVPQVKFVPQEETSK